MFRAFCGFVGMLGIAATLPSSQAAPAADYVALVSQATLQAPGWSNVVAALAAQRPTRVVTYPGPLSLDLRARLASPHPRYVCLVARPEEVTRAFVATTHKLLRRLDDDPYVDCFWGILTGYHASNALAIARTRKPLIVRRVAGGTAFALALCEEGQWYDELKPRRWVKKERGGAPEELQGPRDTTEAMVRLLNEYQPDLFITSGHATERDWQLGFAYRNGSFRHADGRLFGRDLAGRTYPVDSPNPKVYLPIGNCLMGHIDRPDCMATAWMNSAGVRQMIGYTVPTWYGYAGWGMLDYFVEQPGRYTFAEAFVANQQALLHRLAVFFPELLTVDVPPGRRPPRPIRVNERARAAGLCAQDGLGLLYDRDTLAFYGNPAWVARMAPAPLAWRQTLTETNGVFTFTIRPRDRDSFAPINRNGVQRGGRPFIAFLPHRIQPARLLEGAELEPVITDDFVLVPHPGPDQPAQPLRVRFTAAPAQ